METSHLSQGGPILIAGGGIGGLAAALALARAGHEVELFEKAPRFAEIGAGLQVGPNGYRMLHRLGLDREVERLAVLPQELVLMDSVTGEAVTRIPTDERFLERFGHPYTLIHRADLHAVLLNACQNTPGIKLHTGCTVSGFESDPAAGVRLHTLERGHVAGRGLVGADGIWSEIRKAIVGDGAPRISGHIAYRAVLPIEDVPGQFRQKAMILWAGPKNHLVQYPLRGGKLFNLVAVFHSERYVEGWNTEGDPAELKRRFEGTCPAVQSLLGKIEDWRMWVLCDREPIRNWTRGAVTLLGDAAHPMLQYLAQGACMALEDAVCLADCVKRTPEDLPTAFKAYQDARYLRVGKCQIMARVYGEIYHATDVVRELRNAMLAARTQQMSYEGLAWLYDPPSMEFLDELH